MAGYGSGGYNYGQFAVNINDVNTGGSAASINTMARLAESGMTSPLRKSISDLKDRNRQEEIDRLAKERESMLDGRYTTEQAHLRGRENAKDQLAKDALVLAAENQKISAAQELARIEREKEALRQNTSTFNAATKERIYQDNLRANTNKAKAFTNDVKLQSVVPGVETGNRIGKTQEELNAMTLDENMLVGDDINSKILAFRQSQKPIAPVEGMYVQDPTLTPKQNKDAEELHDAKRNIMFEEQTKTLSPVAKVGNFFNKERSFTELAGGIMMALPRAVAEKVIPETWTEGKKNLDAVTTNQAESKTKSNSALTNLKNKYTADVKDYKAKLVKREKDENTFINNLVKKSSLSKNEVAADKEELKPESVYRQEVYSALKAKYGQPDNSNEEAIRIKTNQLVDARTAAVASAAATSGELNMFKAKESITGQHDVNMEKLRADNRVKLAGIKSTGTSASDSAYKTIKARMELTGEDEIEPYLIKKAIAHQIDNGNLDNFNWEQ